MKEKRILKKWMTFFISDCLALKEYLEKMAMQGWKLKKLGIRMEFERCEPKKIFYAVRAFENQYGFKKPSEYEESMLAGKGWVYVDSYNYICVFMTENENVAEIQTDLEKEYKLVRGKLFKQRVLPLCINIPYLFIFLIPAIYNFRMDFIFQMFLYANVFIFLQLIIQTILFIVWTIKSKTMIKEKSVQFYYNGNQVSLKNKLVKILYLIYLALTSLFIISNINLERIENTFIIAFITLLLGTFLFFVTVNARSYEY